MTTLIRPAQDTETGPGTARRQFPGASFGLWIWPALAALACTLTGIRGPLLGTDEDSHTSLRMPSALAMGATAAVVALIGRRLFGGTGPDPLEQVPAEQARALRAQYTTYGTERLSGLTVALLQRKP